MYVRAKNKQDRRKRNHLKSRARSRKGPLCHSRASLLVSPLERRMILWKVRIRESRKSTIFFFPFRHNLKVASSLARIRSSVSLFFSLNTHIYFLRRSVIFTMLNASHRERTSYTSFILLINTNIVGTRLVHILKRM